MKSIIILVIISVLASMPMSAIAEPKLVHFWPMQNSGEDVVGGKDLIDPVNVNFVNDQQGNPSSALYLNDGYYKVPSGDYFQTGSFSITAWVNVKKIQTWMRLIDFGNGQQDNNIFFAIDSRGSGKPALSIRNGASLVLKCYFPNPLPLNEWHHIAGTFDGSVGKLYLDGSEVTSCPSMGNDRYLIMERRSNYVGKSNWDVDGNANAIIDSLKIFDQPLSLDQLKTVMTSNTNLALPTTTMTKCGSSSKGGDAPIHYWPMDLNEKDVCGGQDLLTFEHASYRPDRFGHCRANSQECATHLQSGYYNMPSNVDFFPSGAFTITAWVNLINYAKNMRLLDSSNTDLADNIAVYLSYEETGKPGLVMRDTDKQSLMTYHDCIYPDELSKGRWYHLAITYDYPVATLYLNGDLVRECMVSDDYAIGPRTSTYVGKSNDPSDSAIVGAQAIIDEVKIYKKKISQKQIQNEANYTSNF